MQETKLVHHDGTSGAIYFPVGDIKKGGTCQFASKKCINECGLETNDLTTSTYKFFKKESVGVICEQILKDLFYFPRKLITWFPAGDCPDRLKNKILKIMICLKKQGVVQNGFTRNKDLWCKAVENDINMILTVNTKKEALKVEGKGLVAVPVFACWKADIYDWVDKTDYSKGRTVGYGCGGGWTTVYDDIKVRDKVSVEDCGVCYDKKIRCWA